ncbi:MAG: c-type cytochrome [Tepidamorphaceae bacterium]|nr:c-type cytochrome [Rhodobiaceae bacterium]MCC0048842.1 c-type cytochrome [Rhodobiaceae bacterium]
MLKSLKFIAAFSLLASAACAESFDLGRPATPDEVKAWDTDVRPDGKGLPVGKGSVEEGEVLYTDHCAMCHGDFGEAIGRWPVLAGGKGSLTSARPVKTIGSYWPYLSTVYDYIHRAMPFGDAKSLSDDDVYAITAYVLYLNDLVEDDFELSNENFTDVRLPNEANFYMDDRDDVELAKFSGEVCMTDCKEKVEITARAAVVDVTPDDAAARARREAAAAGSDAAPAEGTETAKAEETPQEVTFEGAAATAANQAMIDAGEKVFKKCRACHQVGENAEHKVGPQLNNVFGRTAGSEEDFKYSKAFAKAHEDGLVWDETTLAAFLAKPKDMIDGTKMTFAGLKKPEDIEALLAYLRTFSE